MKAPDAPIHESRTIKLCHDLNRQSHTAWQLSWTETERREELILEIIGDASELDTLKVWGVEIREVPIVDGWLNLRSDSYWLLHDTPKVRALLLSLRQRTIKVGVLHWADGRVDTIYASDSRACKLLGCRDAADARLALNDDGIEEWHPC